MGCFNSKKSSKGVADQSTSLLRHQKTTKTLKVTESINEIYTLQETIAIVPYGTIVKSIHNSSKLLRSIKIIDLDTASSPIKEKLLKIEVDTLSKLDHPNILKIFDILIDSSKIYIIMEYWKGGLLFDKIKEQNHITEKHTAKIISQILLAVKYCHERKVIHRDLNPKVILMMNNSGYPYIKIGEFGSSVFIDPYQKFEGKFDAWAYVAPEVADENFNEKCDLWSVGIIMHVLLTGKIPFTEFKNSVKKQPLNIKLLQDHDISLNAIDLIQSLLIVDFQQRISASDALSHKWFDILNSNEEKINKKLSLALDNLKCHSATSNLIASVQGFISRHVVTHKDTKSITKAFKAFDKNMDGRVSKEELFRYYVKTMPENEAKKVVDEIFSVADINKSGFLEYSEFIESSMAREKLVSKKNLEAAFRMIDCDGNGKISRAELEGILDGTPLSGDKKWMKLISKADKNQDGDIDLIEFYDLLLDF
jgi:calcium-dependent protein kinase